MKGTRTVKIIVSLNTLTSFLLTNEQLFFISSMVLSLAYQPAQLGILEIAQCTVERMFPKLQKQRRRMYWSFFFKKKKKWFGADFTHTLYYSPRCHIWRLDVGMGYYCSDCCRIAENSSYLAELVLQRAETESQGAETFCSRLCSKEGATAEAEIVSSAFSSPLTCPPLYVRQESSWNMNSGRVWNLNGVK